MPYHETIQFEAQYVDDLGSSAPEDKFRGTYNAIILHWFPSTRGYLVDLQVLGDGGEPKYVVVCHNGGYRNPLIIVNLKPPSEWTAAGKDKVWLELQSNIEGLFDLTKFDTIYGVAGIGLHWMACKMDRLAGHQATQLLDWQDNIAIFTSSSLFLAADRDQTVFVRRGGGMNSLHRLLVSTIVNGEARGECGYVVVGRRASAW